MNTSEYTQNDFILELKKYGYTYIDGEYINCKSLLRCYDEEGYIIITNFDTLKNKNIKPRIFHKINPYTTYNIALYLEKHPECKCKYHSGEYTGAKCILNFECQCGNIFSTTFQNVRYHKKNMCDECTGSHLNLTYEDVKNNLYNIGYNLITPKTEFKRITTTDLICCDNDGYKYKVDYSSVMSGRRMETFSKSNPFAIYNVNIYLKKYTNGTYKCISEKFLGTTELLEISHIPCGRTFKNSWSNIYRKRCLDKPGENKTGAICPFCDSVQLESTHALVLKQVWLHEYSDTEVEEKSCINPITKHYLPTDIVNHRLKIAIEIQSWFHDFEDQKIKDNIKKNYWLSRGYDFYDPDQRDYTILEMIQLFFPQYDKIPNYIDFGYSNKINDIEIQKLLNNGLGVVEISKIVNCKPHQIYDAIQYGRITYPENYQRRDYTSVVQLDNNLNYIAEFKTLKEAQKVTGITSGLISSALRSKTHYSNGYYWIKKDDYYNNNYSIQKSRLSKFNIPVDQFDTDGKFIAHYNTIFDASKEYSCTNHEILEAMNGIRKTRCGYIWKYSNVA